MPFVARNPNKFVGVSVGNGQCVMFVQAAAMTGHTSSWRCGDIVKNSQLAEGTAIATFDADRKYANDSHGRSHAAIYLAQDADGITVLDQWVDVIRNPDGTKTQNVHAVSKRIIKFKDAKKIANDGRSYFVIKSIHE
jgi:hypothetical protein